MMPITEPVKGESRLRQTPPDKQVGTEGRVGFGQTVRLAALVIIVAVIVLMIHWPALWAQGLSSDDGMYLTENRLVQDPSWAGAGRFLSEVLEPSTVKGYYQPLTMISLMLDHASGGRTDDLRAFHRTSLALHVANTALVVVLMYLLFGRPVAAAMVGLLFGVHPLTVDPILWISERKTLLAGFFVFCCLVLYVHYVRKANRKCYVAAVAMYVLALMAKPTSTPVPILLLLLDYWPLRRLSPKALLEKIPFLAFGILFAVITVISQARTAFVDMPMEQSLGRILLILCHNTILYLYKILWPVNLSSHYPFPQPLGLSNPMVLTAVIGTFVLLPMLWISLRWTRALLVGWLLFFAAIFPTMGFIGFTNIIASAKYLYLPAIGLLLPLACLLARLWNAGTSHPGVTKRRVAVLVVVIVLAGMQAFETRRSLDSWRDTETRFRHLLAVTPRSPILLNNYGLHLFRQGKIDDAIRHYTKALELRPTYVMAHTNLCNALGVKGKYDEALEHCAEALRVKPKFAEAHVSLALVLAKQRKIDEAIGHYRQALSIQPGLAEGHLNLGMALKQQGKIAEAVEHYTRALELEPDYAKAHNNLGNVRLNERAYDQAIEHYTKALRINPDLAEAHHNMGLALKRQGNISQAIAAFRQAVRVRPRFAQAHFELGNLLSQQGRLDKAVEEYETVLRIKPDHASARQELEIARARRTEQ